MNRKTIRPSDLDVRDRIQSKTVELSRCHCENEIESLFFLDVFANAGIPWGNQ